MDPLYIKYNMDMTYKLSILYLKHLGPQTYQIFLYLHTYNEVSWGQDPSLNRKFISFVCTLHTSQR
jgi:hypothetical protein